MVEPESLRGVYSADYNKKRRKNLALRYRLKRRTMEVESAIRTFAPPHVHQVLDVGTADGLMLQSLRSSLNEPTCIGLERSMDLLTTNPKIAGLGLIQGNAVELPFFDNTFDVVLVTAVIEHVDRADRLTNECYRVLKPSGVLIVTVAVPFFEKIAVLLRHIDEEGHEASFNQNQLYELLSSCCFNVLHYTKFMMSPIGFPWELRIERWMKALGLTFLLLNQIVVAQK